MYGGGQEGSGGARGSGEASRAQPALMDGRWSAVPARASRSCPVPLSHTASEVVTEALEALEALEAPETSLLVLVHSIHGSADATAPSPPPRLSRSADAAPRALDRAASCNPTGRRRTQAGGSSLRLLGACPRRDWLCGPRPARSRGPRRVIGRIRCKAKEGNLSAARRIRTHPHALARIGPPPQLGHLSSASHTRQAPALVANTPDDWGL